MSQIFLELQPKTKNCLLEEYNQKALARIAMSCYNLLANLVITRWKWCRNLVRNLENKLPAGNIRKLLIELMLQKFRLELRKQKIAGWTLCDQKARSLEWLSQMSFTIAGNEIAAGWSNITIRKLARIEVANKNFVTTTRTGIVWESVARIDTSRK